MSKDIATTLTDTDQRLLLQKTELATKAVDMMLFSGPTGNMLNTIAAMAGIPAVSARMILPTKNQSSMRRFLVSLNSITATVLDDQVDLHSFTAKLAEAIQTIKAITEEEKSRS